jgi:hypothetical protein
MIRSFAFADYTMDAGRMDFDIKPASDYHLNDLVKLLNCGFENYFVPIQFNVSAFLAMFSCCDLESQCGACGDLVFAC